jgi:hypothetical protein
MIRNRKIIFSVDFMLMFVDGNLSCGLLYMLHSFFFIPWLVACVSSTILLYNRCHHRRVHKRTLSVRTRRVQRLSLMLVLFSFSGLFVVLPVCILHILIVRNQIVNQNIKCSVQYARYRILFYWFLSLMTMNYSLKFYARLIVSSPFRRDFARIIGFGNNSDRHHHPLRSSMRHERQQCSPSLLIRQKFETH